MDQKSKEQTDDLNEDEFILKEREKLKKQLLKHKHKVLKIITGCVCIEVVLASIYINISSGITFENVFDIYHDSLDCAIAIFARLTVLYVLTQIAVKFGTPKLYEGDNKHIGLKAKAMKYVLSVWKYIFNYSKAKIHDTNMANGCGDGCENGAEIEKQKIHYTFNLQDLIDKYADIDPNDLAEFWKSTIWLILFTIISIFQGYIGVKTVFFVAQQKYHIMLFGFNILLTHFEMYWIQKYIDDCTEPDNKFFDANIHSHPVFLRSVPGNWCDC